MLRDCWMNHCFQLGPDLTDLILCWTDLHMSSLMMPVMGGDTHCIITARHTPQHALPCELRSCKTPNFIAATQHIVRASRFT